MMGVAVTAMFTGLSTFPGNTRTPSRGLGFGCSTLTALRS